ncbi:hypothetical protein FOZ61_007417 [Perkinsus olseni]|uniref:Endoplasmic reticulum-Golgi intermediate compartment protein 3 n=1 Tax=Perkinsus olseni TaxID=32597 RepID=A0A7J6M8Z0_PEROL|nr:hypothetical protein FOZ61_007417 [Perkinsus olseni]
MLRLQLRSWELRRRYRELDLFRKLPPEVRSRFGPAVNSRVVQTIQVVFIILILLLQFANIVEFLLASTAQVKALRILDQPTEQQFSVDTSETLTSDSKPKLRVMLNITFTNMPCAALSLDYQDAMGSKVVDVRSTIFKTRIRRSDGREISVENNAPRTIVHSENRANGGPQIRLRATNDTEDSCGNCYGAMEADNCCDRCTDVMYAYRLKKWALPRIEDVKQCRDEAAAGQLNTGIIHSGSALWSTSEFEKVRKQGQALDDMIWGGGSVPGLGAKAKTGGWRGASTSHNGRTELLSRGSGSEKGEYFDILHDDLRPRAPAASHSLPAGVVTARNKQEADPGLPREASLVHGGVKHSEAIPEVDSRDAEGGKKAEAPTRGPDVAEESEGAPRRRLREIGRITPYWNRFTPVLARDEVEVESLEEQKGEMCKFWGYFDTAKVPGNFHISTHGVSREAWEQVMRQRRVQYRCQRYLTKVTRSRHPRRVLRPERDSSERAVNFALSGGYAGVSGELSGGINMRHIIHRLHFVDPATNATIGAGREMLAGEVTGDALAYQYYLRVNPASDLTGGSPLHGYQYRGHLVESSLSSHELSTTFKFDIDAIRVSYITSEVTTVSHFVVHGLAIAGGMVAVMMMLIKVAENLSG